MSCSIVPIHVSPRHVTLRIAESGARHFLGEARVWRLNGAGEERTGRADRVVLSIDALRPDTDYRLEVEGCRPLAFRTRACAGLVDARAFAQPGRDGTAGLQAAIAAVPEGGSLLLTPGDWLSGPLFLKSHMTLHLAAGARLLAHGDRAVFPILPALRAGRVLGSWEGQPADCYAALLTAVGCRDLHVTGSGTVDGGGDRGDWWQWPKETRNGARRARTIHLIDCEDVALAGIRVCNSPSWTIHPFGCRRLTAAGLDVENPADSPNTDGLNPESCEDVAIEGVRFSVGDDCIAIKAGKRGAGENHHLAPTRRISVRHCLMQRGHGGVVIGSEMSGDVEDVTIEDCDMRETDRGLRIKTRRGRGGAVRRIAMRRVAMDRVDTAIAVNAFYFCDADGHDGWVQSRETAARDATTPEIDGIDIDELDLTGLRLAVGLFLGLPEAPIRNVRIGRIFATFDGTAEPGLSEMADHLRPLCRAGLVTEHADISLSHASGLTVTEGVSLPC